MYSVRTETRTDCDRQPTGLPVCSICTETRADCERQPTGLLSSPVVGPLDS